MSERTVTVDASALREYIGSALDAGLQKTENAADNLSASISSIDNVGVQLHSYVVDLAMSLREIRNGLTTDIVNAAKNDSQAVLAANSLNQSVERLTQAMLEVNDALDVFKEAKSSLKDVVQLSANLASLRDFVATVSAQLLAQSQRITALELSVKSVLTSLLAIQSQTKTQSIVNLLDVALTAHKM